MGYSVNTHIGDGSTTEFAVSFTGGVLRQSYVEAYVEGEVDGSGEQVMRTITWLDDGLIDVGSPAPADGATVVIRRIMPKDAPLYDFQSRDPLDEETLDESHKQLLMLTHEVLDGYGMENMSTDINTNGHRITNLGAGVDDGDAINKEQFDDVIESMDRIDAAVEQAETAATSASASNTSAQAAQVAAEDAAARAEAAVDTAELPLYDLVDDADKVLTVGETGIEWRGVPDTVTVAPELSYTATVNEGDTITVTITTYNADLDYEIRDSGDTTYTLTGDAATATAQAVDASGGTNWVELRARATGLLGWSDWVRATITVNDVPMVSDDAYMWSNTDNAYSAETNVAAGVYDMQASDTLTELTVDASSTTSSLVLLHTESGLLTNGDQILLDTTDVFTCPSVTETKTGYESFTNALGGTINSIVSGSYTYTPSTSWSFVLGSVEFASGTKRIHAKGGTGVSNLSGFYDITTTPDTTGGTWSGAFLVEDRLDGTLKYRANGTASAEITGASTYHTAGEYFSVEANFTTLEAYVYASDGTLIHTQDMSSTWTGKTIEAIAGCHSGSYVYWDCGTTVVYSYTMARSGAVPTAAKKLPTPVVKYGTGSFADAGVASVAKSTPETSFFTGGSVNASSTLSRLFTACQLVNGKTYSHLGFEADSACTGTIYIMQDATAPDFTVVDSVDVVHTGDGTKQYTELDTHFTVPDTGNYYAAIKVSAQADNLLTATGDGGYYVTGAASGTQTWTAFSGNDACLGLKETVYTITSDTTEFDNVDALRSIGAGFVGDDFAAYGVSKDQGAGEGNWAEVTLAAVLTATGFKTMTASVKEYEV